MRYLLLVLLFSFVSLLAEEPKISHRFSGSIQNWYTYQDGDSVTNNGFGVKRVRARHIAKIGSKLQTFIQVELTSSDFKGALLDAKITYLVSDNVNVSMGRFIGFGPRGGGGTPYFAIDIIERPFTAKRWAANTLGGDYRDTGVQLEAKSQSGFIARASLHNGSGKINPLNNVGGENSSELSPKAFEGQLIFKPKSVKGLEMGAYAGRGNPDIKSWESYALYTYWQPGPYRLKGELIGLNREEDGQDVDLLGYYLFAAVEVHQHIELLGRFERFDPNRNLDSDRTDLITIGAAWMEFPRKWNHRLTAAVTFPMEEISINNNAFQVMWQIHY